MVQFPLVDSQRTFHNHRVFGELFVYMYISILIILLSGLRTCNLAFGPSVLTPPLLFVSCLEGATKRRSRGRPGIT